MSAFAEYATSTAFSVTLSKPQVHMLNMLRKQYHGYCYPGWAHSTIGALLRKGLIERRDAPPNDCSPAYYLTDAGRCVHDLCGYAGLLQESNERMSA